MQTVLLLLVWLVNLPSTLLLMLFFFICPHIKLPKVGTKTTICESKTTITNTNTTAANRSFPRSLETIAADAYLQQRASLSKFDNDNDTHAYDCQTDDFPSLNPAPLFQVDDDSRIKESRNSACKLELCLPVCLCAPNHHFRQYCSYKACLFQY